MKIETKFNIGDKVGFNETLGIDREIFRVGYVKSIDIAVESNDMRIKYFVCIPYNIEGLQHECFLSVRENELKPVSDENTDQVQPK